jgi:hypothetical protein
MKNFFLAAAILTSAAFVPQSPRAAEPAPVTIVVFNPPSLDAVFPSVIKQQKFDIANAVRSSGQVLSGQVL